jgi:hypothetical protein
VIAHRNAWSLHPDPSMPTTIVSAIEAITASLHRTCTLRFAPHDGGAGELIVIGRGAVPLARGWNR